MFIIYRTWYKPCPILKGGYGNGENISKQR